MTEFVPTTTESYRRQHLARADELSTDPHVPGRSGPALCATSHGVIDEERANYWRQGFDPGAQPLVVTDLPLCKRCAKTAELIEKDGL